MNFKLIIGLGNPGDKYTNTYHNVGFWAIDYFIANYGIFDPQNPLLKANWIKPSLKNFEFVKTDKIIFAKLLGFMNNSGKAAQEAIKYFRLKPKDILIIHDDSDIYIGNYKFSFDRGAAGHHGIENIVKMLKTENFWRLRIGIRPPQTTTDPTQTNADKIPRESAINRKIRVNPRLKAGEFVLKNITAARQKTFQMIFGDAAKKIKDLQIKR
ncbi:MAG: peptidyl-tRNA hydrolase, PTH1 family [Parcubacteria group bacterium Athens0714_26]|nr:MAG: peptidyl-tRNA hydrolase, PTH1 family [Parcubacteria group bacterium Athens1014_26]TSD01914.1 MAG: peptidyl-tRNA hydrolase, PTH1 family [Parcubacteria group bacterium Athens0714_26]